MIVLVLFRIISTLSVSNSFAFAYFPMLDKKNAKFSWCPRFIRHKFIASLPSARFKIGCNRPLGAISMQIAFFGIFPIVWWNNTGDSKLLARYAAEHCWAIDADQFDSGMLVLNHRPLRFVGVGISFSSDWWNFGPASAMYWLCKAYPHDLTTLAKVPSCVS